MVILRILKRTPVSKLNVYMYNLIDQQIFYRLDSELNDSYSENYIRETKKTVAFHVLIHIYLESIHFFLSKTWITLYGFVIHLFTLCEVENITLHHLFHFTFPLPTETTTTTHLKTVTMFMNYNFWTAVKNSSSRINLPLPIWR